MSRRPQAILITGASSGLGQALALAYAGPGITLFLSGRDRQRLHDVADACRARKAVVHALVINVTQAVPMATWIKECDGIRPLDLVIANAGISAGTGDGGGESADQARTIFAVNVDGVMNTVFPAIDIMRGRRHGQIAIMASLAGYRGLPGAPSYCASKAAVKAWGEGLRGLLARDGVRVSVICPGFVTTRMTAVNTFKMPFLMDADRAARIMVKGLARNRGRIAFPWPMAFGAWLSAALPDRLMGWIGARMPDKG
ncbi:putative Short-chain dehydrogenase/reductase SDR family protein [Magnetospirillum gryphiswaldense MSR-1 v2]|uniref:Short-chain dehydrogenase/reductase SDR family protein n=1 Tax=Magnetospirillum gryphiswaldense (strain DSM 6361 / JCM 21280 / NBRC 15271 / MSR-1) TaxID=431944 RepID=V6F0R0_MAGGM|nr:SDR family NAD(P)-dependent oxidoreductase [Magnetospirillum gryphiswaldense]CDK99095.1 putative Short-chain dehydrogenase/reductase SDR family protein [Magnetospirillum gryphiswaldense MSR-1 v2]